jgi:hypothetical protein
VDNNGTNPFDKNDAIKALELTNGWTANCDTKTSLVLGAYGVVAGVLLITEFYSKLWSILTSIFRAPYFCGEYFNKDYGQGPKCLRVNR